jgi:hypothetical protein
MNKLLVVLFAGAIASGSVAAMAIRQAIKTAARNRLRALDTAALPPE